MHHPNLDDSEHALSHPKVDVLYNPNLNDSETGIHHPNLDDLVSHPKVVVLD